jgi:hypothetical protein
MGMWDVKAVATAARLRVIARGSKVVVDAVGCRIWTLGLQSRWWHGGLGCGWASSVGIRVGGGSGAIHCNHWWRQGELGAGAVT